MPTFTDDIVTAVLRHMNEDHPEDNILIVTAFGHKEAWAATMIGLDGDGGSWAYLLGDDERVLTVPWSGPITERPEMRSRFDSLFEDEEELPTTLYTPSKAPRARRAVVAA